MIYAHTFAVAWMTTSPCNKFCILHLLIGLYAKYHAKDAKSPPINLPRFQFFRLRTPRSLITDPKQRRHQRPREIPITLWNFNRPTNWCLNHKIRPMYSSVSMRSDSIFEFTSFANNKLMLVVNGIIKTSLKNHFMSQYATFLPPRCTSRSTRL